MLAQLDFKTAMLNGAGRFHRSPDYFYQEYFRIVGTQKNKILLKK